MDDKQDTAIQELKKALSESKSPNTLLYIYQRVRTLTEPPSKGLQVFTFPPLLKSLQYFLADRDREVRVAALRTLRYMAICEEVLKQLSSYQILHFLTRCFETEGKNHEKIEACKFMKNWLEISPATFPRDFMNALVALGETDNEELKEFAVEAIRILCVSNSNLVAQCGGVRVLIASLTDTQILMENHVNTILTLVYLLNTKETRVLLKNESEVLKIFAVFTNFDQIYQETEFNCLLSLAKLVVKTMSRSWVGLFFLASRVFKDILKALVVPCDLRIKVAVLETLEEMLNLQIDTSVNRPNLLKTYLGLMTKSLLDSNVVSLLNQVISTTKSKLVPRCKNILRKLYIYSNDLLPEEALKVFTNVKVNFTSGENWQGSIKNSNFLYLCCQEVSKEPFNCLESSDLVIREIFKSYQARGVESDALCEVIRKSRIMEDCSKWKWDLISSLLFQAEQKESIFIALVKENVFRSLINFFTPSRQKFSVLAYRPENFQVAEIGRRVFLLLTSHSEGVELLSTSPVEDFFLIRVSFFEELRLFLEKEVLKHGNFSVEDSSRLFSLETVSQTMTREYLKWLALLTFNEKGVNLLSSLSLDTILLNLSLVPHICSVLLPYLNYQEALCKTFISISLSSPKSSLKHQSLQQLHLLHKAGNHDLSWAVQELVTLAQSSETGKPFVSLLTELNQDPRCRAAFIETGQDLRKLGEEGKNCLISLLSSEAGVAYLNNLDFISGEIENWTLHGHENYIKQLENKSETGLNLEFKAFALEIFTPFKNSVDDRAECLWLSRIPFYVKLEVTNQKSQLFPVVVQVDSDDVFIQALDVKAKLLQGDSGQVCLMVAGNFVGSQGNENQNWVKFDVATLEKNPKYENCGVIFHSINDRNSVLLKSCSFRVKIMPKVCSKLEFPVHLFAELGKTETGFRELTKRIDIQQFVNCLTAHESIFHKRVALWALGNIGSTEIGARYLQGLQAVKVMTQVAEESEVLSLRGTAFQALCLVSSTKTGRKMLELQGWTCSESNLCLPNDSSQIFKMEKIDFSLMHQERNIVIQERLKGFKLNQEQEEILFNVLNVSNFSRKNEAENFLRAKRQQKPESFEDFELFHAVMEHLAVFNFNLRTRKMVHKLFDKIYKTQSILDERSS
jgi:hypothetical protein